MEIHFKRSGGIMGLVIDAAINTQTLAEEDAQAVEDLVAASNFFALPEKLLPDALVPDEMYYVVGIKRAEEAHRVETSDTGATDGLRPLLRKLEMLARGQK
jgi:hypothetical protein